MGAAASLPAALVLSISGPLGTQQSSDDQVVLSTGGPVSSGQLAPLTGTAMTAGGQLTLVAAGQLTGGYVSGDFALTLSGTLAPARRELGGQASAASAPVPRLSG